MNTRTLSRRTLLTLAAAGMGCHAATAAAAPFFARHGLAIGVQLYTLGEAAQQDLPGTLGALARIGYRTVELAGFLGRSARELRAALDQAGLSCRSAHVPGQPRAPGEPSLSGDLTRLAEDAHILGIQHLVLPTFVFPAHDDRLRPGESGLDLLIRAGQSMTAADWRANAAFLNSLGRRLRPLGLKVGYHNHNFEFAPLSQGNGLEILLRETDKDLVDFELDVGWAAAAGQDPVEILQRHPGRFRQMHVKDIRGSTRTNTAMQQDPTEIGSGIIPWPRILPVAFKSGVREFYVEQEPPFAGPRLESVRRSFDYLSGLAAGLP